MTIAVWIFVQIFLVLLFGAIKIFNRRTLHDDCVKKISLQIFQRLFDNFFVGRVAEKNSRAILNAAVVALPIDERQVNRLIVNVQKFRKRNAVRVIDDVSRLGVAAVVADVVISRIARRAVGVADLHVDDAGDVAH